MEHKFGDCQWCKQKKMLIWVLGRKKGTDDIWSGWVCDECYKKAQENGGDDK